MMTLQQFRHHVAAGITDARDVTYFDQQIMPSLLTGIGPAAMLLMADPAQTRQRLPLETRQRLARELLAETLESCPYMVIGSDGTCTECGCECECEAH